MSMTITPDISMPKGRGFTALFGNIQKDLSNLSFMSFRMDVYMPRREPPVDFSLYESIGTRYPICAPFGRLL